MAGISLLRKLLMKQAVKKSGQASGIMSIGSDVRKLVEKRLGSYIDSAQRQGVDLDKMSEQELKYILELNKPKGPMIGEHRVIDAASSEGQGITRDLFNMLDRRSGKNVIKTDFGGGITDDVSEIIIKIKTMEPMDAMKEANRVLKGEGRYKSLSKADRKKIVDDESITDHIFERNIIDETEDFAQGGRSGSGLNYLLGEDDQNVRVPYAGGGFNKARRAFLKWAGAGAAGIGAAKSGLFGLLKAGKAKSVIAPATHAANQIIETPGMPYWFKPLVNKVIKEGDDVTKKFATQERQIVHNKKLGDPKDVYADEITVTQELDTGNVRVEYHAGSNMGDAPIQLDYKAGEIIEQGSKKGKTTKPEFSAVESEPRVVNWDGDIEWDGENVVNVVDDLLTDTTKLETYATGKKPNIKKLLKSEQKQKYVNKLHDDQMEQINYIENKHGHIAPEDLIDEGDAAYHKYKEGHASGGRVPLAGGLAGMLGE